ncbi:hypothetical protein ACVOMV_37750 [Mesorhizobium atlanticum]
MLHLHQRDDFERLQVSRRVTQNGFGGGARAPEIAGKVQLASFSDKSVGGETVAFLQLNYQSLILSENTNC